MGNKSKAIYVILPILVFVIAFSRQYIRKSNDEMESLQIAQQEDREARSKAEEAMNRNMEIINNNSGQEESEYGIVRGNTYTYSYFGFVLTLPEGFEFEKAYDTEVTATNATDGTAIEFAIDSVSEGTSTEQAIEAYKKVIEQTLVGQTDSIVVDYKVSDTKTCKLANEEYAYFDYEQVYNDGDTNLVRYMMRCKGTQIIGITFYGDKKQIKKMMECFSAV